MNFRENVAGVLQRQDGRILIAERADHPGSWQFPQGGVDEGESLQEALQRELEEEVSLRPESYAIVRSVGPVEYVFSAGKQIRGFDGQRQTCFLLELRGKESDFSIETAEAEFRAIRWIMPQEFDLSWAPNFKRELLKMIFSELFSVKLNSV